MLFFHLSIFIFQAYFAYNVSGGFQESHILQQLTVRENLEPKADNCTQVRSRKIMLLSKSYRFSSFSTQFRSVPFNPWDFRPFPYRYWYGTREPRVQDWPKKINWSPEGFIRTSASKFSRNWRRIRRMHSPNVRTAVSWLRNRIPNSDNPALRFGCVEWCIS